MEIYDNSIIRIYVVVNRKKKDDVVSWYFL